jgi:UDP-glucose 4-epimerase
MYRAASLRAAVVGEASAGVRHLWARDHHTVLNVFRLAEPSALFRRHLAFATAPSNHADDLATAAGGLHQANVVDGAGACGHGASGRVINVATGSSISLNALFEAMRRLIGASVKPVYAEPRAGDVRDSLADLRLAKEILGYKPIVPFEEGLRLTVEWYRSLATTT